MAIAKPVQATRRQQIQAALHFQPTVECINQLPDALRRWIMELETKCDPSGDLQRAVLGEDLCRQLEAMLLQLKEENRRLRAQLRQARVRRNTTRARG
jgi:hypothetical protein